VPFTRRRASSWLLVVPEASPPRVPHALLHLGQGASVGGHGEPVGVGYTFPRHICRVLWQGVDGQRRVPFEQVERDGLSRIHGEHNSATLTIAAVRLNALTHGLLSEEILLPGEDETALRELAERLMAEL
jgi:hypothetical protein